MLDGVCCRVCIAAVCAKGAALLQVPETSHITEITGAKDMFNRRADIVKALICSVAPGRPFGQARRYASTAKEWACGQQPRALHSGTMLLLLNLAP
jgi:hypothetical protein